MGSVNVLEQLQEPKQEKESSVRDRGVHSPAKAAPCWAGQGMDDSTSYCYLCQGHYSLGTIGPEVTSVGEQPPLGDTLKWNRKTEPPDSSAPCWVGCSSVGFSEIPSVLFSAGPFLLPCSSQVLISESISLALL